MIDAFLADENMPLQVRIEAAMVTKDISLLEKIAAGGGETKLRRAALECITDHNVLRRIRDEVPDLREAACERLGHDTEYAGTEKIGGDTFIVFRCRICGRESRMPAE